MLFRYPPTDGDATWNGIKDVALFNLLLLYTNQGADDKAIGVGGRDLELRERMYGRDDPRTADTLESLAFVRSRKSDNEAAVDLYERALTIRRAHKATDAASLEKLFDAAGALYEKRAQYDKAEQNYREALSFARERTDAAPKAVAAHKSLARVAEQRGRWSQAEGYVGQIIAIIEEAGGPGHPASSVFLHDQAVFQEAQGQFKKAEASLTRALKVRESEQPPKTMAIAQSLNDLALFYDRQERFSEAGPLYARGLAMVSAERGETDEQTVSLLVNLGAHNSLQKELSRGRGALQARDRN